MPTNELSDLITQAEAARLRGVSREAIYGLVARRKLSIVEIGGQKFVRRSEVESYTPEVGGRPPLKSKFNGAGRKKGGRK
jgi:excisionase family DNA binding protein